MSILVFALLFLLFLFEVPIAWSLAITALFYLVVCDIPLAVISQAMYSSLDSFTLLSVPLFVVAGSIMARGGISKRIVDVASALVGYIYGGLAMTVALSCAFFGAISGSANATAAAIGGITLPSMVEKGYKKSWSATYIASASIVGVLIPPSIPFILYGASAGVSIGQLFLGGLIPGVLISGGLMTAAYIYSKKTGEGVEKGKFSLKKLAVSVKEGAWAMGMPVIILGGVFSGIFTATESAAVAVVYGIIVSVFIYKEIKIKDLPDVFGDAVALTAAIGLILQAASVFGWVITAEQLPQGLLKLLTGISENPVVILLLLNVFFLILGTFFETVAAIIMMTPIVVPIINAVGISPLHFGVMMVTNLAVGMITPPLGVVLFVSCSIANIKVNRMFKHLWPLLGVCLLVLVLVTLVPELSTWIPKLVFK